MLGDLGPSQSQKLALEMRFSLTVIQKLLNPKIALIPLEDENKNTTAALSDEDVAVLFFGDEECLPVTDNEVEWIIDTTTSYHVTPNKEFFTSYRPGDFGTMKM